ncbi:MAG: glycosyltransferase [Oscillospiraceae bacterium]|nr:glycosyltransferase [Oscillospiraceae bacterium]
MKVAQINVTCGSGSTGRICRAVSELLTEKGIENRVFYSEGESDYPLGVKYTLSGEVKAAALRSRLFGNYGFNSRKMTERLLSMLDEMKPDIVHLHNLHGHNCDLSLLLTALRDRQIKVFWTFHDCWAFTGYCPHFDMIGCEKWTSRCSGCPQKKSYSWFFDRSAELQEKKRQLLCGLDLTVITPSKWLAALVKESFLSDVPVKVIPNGIDLSVFHPTPSDIRDRLSVGERKLLLAVAYHWDERKGADVLGAAAKALGDAYRIVAVGAGSEGIEGENVLALKRTESQKELAELYTAADLFLNPTREDSFPTVNMEALACGTPVLTFDTGGSGEIIDDSCGLAVKKNDTASFIREIVRITQEKPYDAESCLKRAESFDMREKFRAYVDLYV